MANVQLKHNLGLSIEDYRTKPRTQLILVCQNLTGELNVGTIIRTADSLLVGKIYLYGKSWSRGPATGAHGLMPVEYTKDLDSILQRYKEDGFRITALEQATGSISLVTYDFHPKTVLILGNEGTGVTPDLLEYADDSVAIPHLGWTESLNVAVAASVAMWEYTKQHQANALAQVASSWSQNGKA